MIKCALLLLSCLTIFAQRTPLSVNGTIVNNPNFTNTASVTWSVTGPNIRGTAAAGSDSFWTNSSVASGSIQPVGGSNVYMPGTLAVVGQLTNDALQASQLVYSGPDKVLSSISPGNSGDVLTSSGAGIAPSFLPASGGDTIWTNDNGTISATSTSLNGTDLSFTVSDDSYTTNITISSEGRLRGVIEMIIAIDELTTDIYDGAVDMLLRPGIADDNSGLNIRTSEFVDLAWLRPGMSDGIPPFSYDTTIAHTTNNLMELKNKGTNRLTIDYAGVITSSSLTSSRLIGTSTNNSLISISGPFNVKLFGAVGDARKVTDAVLTNSSTTVISMSAPFVSTDVGKKVWGIETATGLARLPVGTISTVVSSSNITVSVAATGNYSSINLVWGTDDSTAIRSAVDAAKAVTPAGIVVCPPGGYVFSKCLVSFKDSTTDNISFVGSGSGSTFFYVSPDYDYTTTQANDGIFLKALAPVNIPSHVTISGFTIDASSLTFTSGYSMIYGRLSKSQLVDVSIRNARQLAAGLTIANGSLNLVSKCRIESTWFGVNVNSPATFVECYIGNQAGYGLTINGIAGTADGGSYVRWYGGIIDENTDISVKVQGSSTDISFIGAKIMAGAGAKALQVENASIVKLDQCEVTPYSSNNNSTGARIDSGGTLYALNSRLKGSGTGFAVNNAGTFYDLGGNTFTGGTTGAGVFSGVNTMGGFGSTATDTAVTIASTGWTNTFGKNAVVYMDGVGLTYTVYNNALTPVYTNSVTVANATVLLQTSGKVIITAGTLGVGRATPF